MSQTNKNLGALTILVPTYKTQATATAPASAAKTMADKMAQATRTIALNVPTSQQAIQQAGAAAQQPASQPVGKDRWHPVLVGSSVIAALAGLRYLFKSFDSN